MARFKLITSVYLFLIERNKVLLSRRLNTGYEDGKYGLPAGHLEDNESVINALKRETKEEIGIKVEEKNVELVHVMHRKEKDIRIDLFFTTNSYKGRVTNKEPEKCDDLKWVDVDSLPKNTVGYIAKALENYRKGIIYSQIGW